MRSICFFASYFSGLELPYYVTIYLKELKRHFGEVVLLSSQQELSTTSLEFLRREQISYNFEKNEGFDFGLWYKAFQKTNVTLYDQVALVNDSCILFKSLDDFIRWSRLDAADMQGMSYSEAIAPHLQSFFLIIHKNALKTVDDFFKAHGIIQNIGDVIRTYEVGLSTYLMQNGFTISAYMNKDGAQGEFSPYYTHVKEHLRQGIPLIKKKILYGSYRKDELFTLARMNFDVNARSYVRLIREQNQPLLLSFDTLFSSGVQGMSPLMRARYRLLLLLVKAYRKIKR